MLLVHQPTFYRRHPPASCHFAPHPTGSPPSITDKPAEGRPLLPAPRSSLQRPSGAEAGPRKTLPDSLPSGLCDVCLGAGSLPCTACTGTGRLPKGGYQLRNRIDKSRIHGQCLLAMLSRVPSLPASHSTQGPCPAHLPSSPPGSKWTAMTRTLGWRHFAVAAARPAEGGGSYLLLQASMDPKAKIWVRMHGGLQVAARARDHGRRVGAGCIKRCAKIMLEYINTTVHCHLNILILPYIATCFLAFTM